MNKKVLKAAFVAAIAMVSGINVFNAQKSEPLSDVVMANVEALAKGEGEGGGHVYVGLPCADVPDSYCIYLGPEPDDYFEWPGVIYC